MSVRLEESSSGHGIFEYVDLAKVSDRTLHWIRKRVQMIFQDLYASLNPRRQIARNLLSKIGLNQDAYEKYPHEFSGGQRQRVVIARAVSQGSKDL